MSGLNAINNVPLDYFLHGIASQDAVPPTGQAPQAPGGNAAQVAPEAPPRPTGARSLVAQLDVLLLQSAKLSSGTVGEKAAAEVKDKLREADLLSKQEADLLMKCQAQAQKSLKALEKFTGQQLGNAFKLVNGKLELDSSKAGKACRAAIQAQNDLSDVLAQISRRVNRAENAPEGLDEQLIELRQVCDRRATEIQSLAFRMHDFALYAAARGGAADPNVKAILKATAAELLPRQALAMHGTADVLEGKGAAADFAESLKPLAARIDAFAAKPDAGIGDAEVEQIQSEIARMKAAVATVRREGIPSGNGRMRVAEDILSAVDSMLAKAEAAFSRSKNLVGDAMRRNTLETMRGLMAFDGARQKEVEKNCPHAKALFDARDAFLKDLKAYVDSAAEDPSSQKTKDLFNAAVGSAFDMRDAAKKVTVKVAREMGADFYRFQTRARGAHTVMAHLKALMRRIDETPTERLLTGASARSLFAGQVSVPDVVEARARGLRETDVDPATAPDRLESSKRLGAGGAGEVFELQFAGGKTFVFKGETESRGGLSTQSVGAGAAYTPEQQVVQLNLASRAVADKLGFGGHIVKYSVGSHEGTFGMFMEKAKGMGVKDYRADSSKAPPGGLSADKIRRLPPEDRKRVRGEIRRQLNQLQWLDTVTGQLDRNHANYFVFVDARTLEVTVRGIDNDASFSTLVEGPGQYELDEKRTGTFLKNVRTLAKQLNPADPEGQEKALLADPGLRLEGGRLAVDTAKIQSPALLACLRENIGTQGAVVPDRIDRDMYDALMALKNDPAKRQALLDDLRDRLPPAAVDKQAKRLDAAIAHAEALAEQGRVVEADAWGDVTEGSLPPDKPLQLVNSSGQKASLTGKQSFEANILRSPSIAHRDQLEDIF